MTDAFIANCVGPDRGIGTRLAFWQGTFGAHNAPGPDADALDELERGGGGTYPGRDKASGDRGLQGRGHAPMGPATVNCDPAFLRSVDRWARRRRLLPRDLVAPARSIERATVNNTRFHYLDEAKHARLLTACSILGAAAMLSSRNLPSRTGVRRLAHHII